MTCNVLIRNNSAGNSILIPFKCVLEQMGEFFVFVVKDNKVHQQKVIPGRRIGDKVIIKDGLAANETIVTDGVQKLKDGSAVNVGGSAESGKASKASSPDSTKEK
jgi:membrane fusion protein (multidrug efflux system)